MKNVKHFNPQHFSKELKKKFTKGMHHISIGDVFEKDGKRYQYTGSDDNGNIAAVFLRPDDTNHAHLVGVQIKKARIARGWNQTQLSEASNLRLATISEIETGKANFQINTISQIAQALNCYLDISFTPVG